MPKKIEFAHQAVAVQQLQMSDRISVTIFDDQVETLIPSTHLRLRSQTSSVKLKHSTQRQYGSPCWLARRAGKSVPHPEHINRVLLLSDGLANGETNPDVIASDVHGLARRGVSTSTIGVGNDYSEDLLEAIARSGDGNYYYIESPHNPPIFSDRTTGLDRNDWTHQVWELNLAVEVVDVQ